MSVTLNFTRDLDTRKVAVEIDQGEHSNEEAVVKWGRLGLRYARMIGEAKTFDYSPHLADMGCSITLSDTDLDEDFDDEWEEEEWDEESAAYELAQAESERQREAEQALRDALSEGDDTEAEDAPEYRIESKLDTGDHYKRIGGFEAPSVVMSHLVYKLLTRALKKA